MVVDANVWVVSALPHETHHAPSRAWLQGETQRGRRLVVPSLAIIEVAGAVARASGSSALGMATVRGMSRTSGLRVAPLDRVVLYEATALAAELRLRGADAIYVAVAVREGLPLITWDRQVLGRAGTVVSVLSP